VSDLILYAPQQSKTGRRLFNSRQASLGHRLRPRSLAPAEGELGEVLAGLFGMLAKQKEEFHELSNYRLAQGAI